MASPSLSAGSFSLSAFIDGARLSFDGVEVCTWPSLEAAEIGYRTAKEAQGMLAATLAMAPSRRSA